jgi:hypothetical protein
MRKNSKISSLQKFAIDVYDGIKFDYLYEYNDEKISVPHLLYDTHIHAQKETLETFIEEVIDKNQELSDDLKYKESVKSTSSNVVESVIDTFLNNDVTNISNISSIGAPNAKKLIIDTKNDISKKVSSGELKMDQLTDTCISLLNIYASSESENNAPNSGPEYELRKGLSDISRGISQQMKHGRNSKHGKRLLNAFNKRFYDPKYNK